MQEVIIVGVRAAPVEVTGFGFELHALGIPRTVTRGTDEGQLTSGGINRIEVTITHDGVKLAVSVAGNGQEVEVLAGDKGIQFTSTQIDGVKIF